VASVGGIWRAGSGSVIHQHRSEGAASPEIRRQTATDPMLFQVGPYRKPQIPRSGLCPGRPSPRMRRF
jgi:hypothetical protein